MLVKKFVIYSLIRSVFCVNQSGNSKLETKYCKLLTTKNILTVQNPGEDLKRDEIWTVILYLFVNVKCIVDSLL